MTLLLTLNSGSLTSLLDPKADPPRTLFDVPAFTIDELGLRGLNIHADMLSGWSARDIDQLRHRADQAGCPCLVLLDRTPLEIAHESDETRATMIDRITRLTAAAIRLGCNSIAIEASVPVDDEAARTRAIETIREVMPAIERGELVLLLAPSPGLTEASEGLTSLIKAIGGFRIGAMPTYGDPNSPEEAVEHIRRLAPYAGAIQLRVEGFKRTGRHRGLDLVEGLEAALTVGYQSTIAIDFVGDDDPIKSIAKAAEILQAAVDQE